MGQTYCFVKLEKVNTPVKLNFLVCLDDGNEALLSLDTLKDLSIVSRDFPCPMDDRIKDHKARRIVTEEEEDEWPEQKLREEKQRENEKQIKRKVQEHRLYTLQERVGSLQSQFSFKQVNEKEWEEEKECEEVRKAWLRDYPEVFKEDLSKEDRIDMDPVVVDLIPNHEQVEVFHPKACNEVPAYLKNAADKELKRMLEGGLLEPAPGYSPIVSRGFFIEKHTAPGEEVKVRLVADFRGVNRKLQRPEHPLDNSWGILKRLNPHHRFFAAIVFSSGYSQIPLAEE